MVNRRQPLVGRWPTRAIAQPTRLSMKVRCAGVMGSTRAVARLSTKSSLVISVCLLQLDERTRDQLLRGVFTLPKHRADLSRREAGRIPERQCIALRRGEPANQLPNVALLVGRDRRSFGIVVRGLHLHVGKSNRRGTSAHPAVVIDCRISRDAQ